MVPGSLKLVGMSGTCGLAAPGCEGLSAFAAGDAPKGELGMKYFGFTWPTLFSVISPGQCTRSRFNHVSDVGRQLQSSALPFSNRKFVSRHNFLQQVWLRNGLISYFDIGRF